MWPSNQTYHDRDYNDHHETQPTQTKKLRTACDRCHHAKMKCTGGMPCAGCSDSREQCCYSVSHRPGRPKGARNKRNFEQVTGKHRTKTPFPLSDASSLKYSNDTPQHPHPSTGAVTPTQGVLEDGLGDLESMLVDAASKNTLSLSPSQLWEHLDFNEVINPDGGQRMTVEGDTTYDTLSAFTAFPASRTEDPHLSLDDRLSYDTSPTPSLGDGGFSTGGSAGSSITAGSTAASSHNLFSALQLSTPRSYTTSPTQTAEPILTCNCLEQHTELLGFLKGLEQGNNKSSVDGVLIGVQKALVPWQNLTQCRVCPYDDGQAVLILSVMSIRSILRRLQRICTGDGFEIPTSGYSTPAMPSITSVRVTLGNYEATGNEQKLVTDLLIIHALGKVKFALLSLKDKFEQSRRQQSPLEPRSVSSTNARKVLDEQHPDMNVECIQQLLRSLEGTVQAVGHALRTKNSG